MKLFTSLMLITVFVMPAFSHQAASAITDGQIISIIMAVDESEIAAANIVKNKKAARNVAHYARYLKKQHKHNLYRLKQLEHETGLTPMKSAQSVAIAKDARLEGTTLASLNGQAFDSAYIDCMVKGHAGGLKLINTVLLKDVTNVKLKKFVENFRTLVKRHLEKGKEIQKTMH